MYVINEGVSSFINTTATGAPKPTPIQDPATTHRHSYSSIQSLRSVHSQPQPHTPFPHTTGQEATHRSPCIQTESPRSLASTRCAPSTAPSLQLQFETLAPGITETAKPNFAKERCRPLFFHGILRILSALAPRLFHLPLLADHSTPGVMRSPTVHELCSSWSWSCAPMLLSFNRPQSSLSRACVIGGPSDQFGKSFGSSLIA